MAKPRVVKTQVVKTMGGRRAVEPVELGSTIDRTGPGPDGGLYCCSRSG